MVVISTTNYNARHLVNEAFSLKTQEVMKFSRHYAQKNGGELDKEVTKRHTWRNRYPTPGSPKLTF